MPLERRFNMDYNIYLHSSESFEGSEPTTPWSARESSDSQGFQSVTSKTIESIKETPNQLVALGKDVIGVVKKHPVVAAALAVITIADKAVDTMSSFYSAETGQYAFRTGYHNIKNGINAVFHPVSSTMNYLRQQQQYKLDNERAEVQRSLFGDIAFNNGHFYGV